MGGDCPDCGFLLKSTWIVCPKCGHALANKCLKCKEPLETGWKACPHCGEPLALVTRLPSRKVNPTKSPAHASELVESLERIDEQLRSLNAEYHLVTQQLQRLPIDDRIREELSPERRSQWGEICSLINRYERTCTKLDQVLGLSSKERERLRKECASSGKDVRQAFADYYCKHIREQSD